MTSIVVSCRTYPLAARCAVVAEDLAMKAVCLLPLCACLLLGSNPTVGSEDLPPAAKETLDAYEKELAEIQKKADEETKKAVDRAAVQLKALQDKFCKEAKLDEAVAIRDHIRRLQAGEAGARPRDLPPAAGEVLDALDKETAEVQKRVKERVRKVGEKADAQLKILQDKYCKEVQLDEAVAVRDARRLIRLGVVNARPDPGYLNAEPADIGKVWYFEVVGNTQGQTWGSEVYTTGSHLATTAIHAGVLRLGQKDIVKVTILPGQAGYESTTRNGVTSQPWSNWGVSFKVERLTGLAGAAPKD
jgi:hypothetical protein